MNEYFGLLKVKSDNKPTIKPAPIENIALYGSSAGIEEYAHNPAATPVPMYPIVPKFDISLENNEGFVYSFMELLSLS